ncbi:hypothetical protein O988_00201 [Pseudogymnoascus sp. VKM F-3808]|nr:hypothetical protein O988_00201 [Pseudogymnoascus sp. VKM F-3808]
MVSQPHAFTTTVWNQFLQLSVSQEMIRYIAQKVSNVAEINPSQQNPGPNRITSRQHSDKTHVAQGLSLSGGRSRPALDYFISAVVGQANIQAPILLTTLLYLSRLHPKLPTGIRYTPHIIFLACLILSEKFLEDNCLCNRDWAICSQFDEFGLSNEEVNILENEVLFLLDWNLNFQISELEHHLKPIIILIRPTASIRSIAYRGNGQVLNNRMPRGKSSDIEDEYEDLKVDIRTK